MSSALTLLALVAAAAGLLLAVARPALACALLAAAIPLTAGLGRGTVVPLLRVNEALLLVVAAGVLIGRLPRRWPLPFDGLDLAVLAFCLGSVLIPWAVILLSGAVADQQVWTTVLGPLQYLAVYVLFSQTRFSSGALRLFLKLAMLASIPVALVALAQLVDVGGVRALVDTYYPAQPMPSWDKVYRPASLLGFYSAVGAFGLLNFLLALALSATRHPGFSQRWLAVVMAVNVVGLLASKTYAPLLALPAGVLAVLLVARRVPWRQMAAALPGLAISAVVLWPLIGGRVQEEFAGAGSLSLPETMGTRFEFWQGFFVPALLAHGLWLGTGTLIPSEVPRPLVDFVDNAYLYQGFRAGLPGLALEGLLLAILARAAWRTRASPDASVRALGGTCLAAVACLLLLDTTSEYLQFTAVSQEFWMLAGLLAGTSLATRAMPAPFLELSLPHSLGEVAQPSPSRRGRWSEGPEGVRAGGGAARTPARARLPDIRRPRLGGALVRSSLVVLAGFGLARLLGFGFQVASGRLLPPADYGRLTYALAVATVASVLLTTAPVGLSRFLARHADHPAEQGAYYSNWLAVVGMVLAGSLAMSVVVGPRLGLGGWLLAGLLANVLGVAALETYREVQRGLGRYALQSAFYVLANALQLAAVLGVSALGWRSAPLFLVIYGLSAVGALVAFAPLTRDGPRLSVSALRWSRLWEVTRFVRPLLLLAVFWNVWFSADLILVQHLRNAADTGTYAAAKAIANGLIIIPTAIGFVWAPRVARLDETQLRGQLLRVMALTAAVVLPLSAGVAAASRPLTAVVFGGRYAAAAGALAVLAVGMGLFGLRSALGALWLGVGHPVVETAATGVAMLVTLGTGLLLIPAGGPVGAATAFSAGALSQLLVEGAVAVWAFRGPAPRIGQRADGGRPRELPAGQPAPVLLVAEELHPELDEAYAKFVDEVADALARRRPVLRHLSGAGRWDRVGPVRALRRSGHIVLAALRRDLGRPAVVAYASRSSVTVMALLRARAMKLLLRGVPVALIALQDVAVRPGRLLRLLAPDLLLLPTERDCLQARRAGVNAARVWGGVDLERFRPALDGEKLALRRQWGLPADRRTVLHVGHLREGRNLGPLAAMAARGATVVLVASGRRGPESGRLKRALTAAGVVVVEGYQGHVEELYRLADCYVFPTRSRRSAAALPLSVLEALASDVPVASLRFGALAEALSGAGPGVVLADSPGDLVESALALAGAPVRTRPLAEPFAWPAISERLLGLLDDLTLVAAPRQPVRIRLSVLRAKARRAYVARRAWLRQLRWGDAGLERRPAAGVSVVPALRPGRARPAAEPGTDVVGLLGPGPDGTLAAVARLCGLALEKAGVGGVRQLVDRALAGRWRLLHGPLEELDLLSDVGWEALAAFVEGGGTLYVDGVGPEAGQALARLGSRLRLRAPGVIAESESRSVAFPSGPASFSRELAGARVLARCRWPALAPGGDWEVLALGETASGRLPLAVRRRLGRGSLVLTTAPAQVGGALGEVLAAGSTAAAAAVIPLLLLRGLYGAAAWHPPAVLANFTIDDPALRRGLLGLRWDLLLGQARDHGFHVTIASVPCELRLAEPAVVELLRRHPESLSVCYHGCDHDGYEFYAPDVRRTRYPARPLAAQREALDRAVEHARRFAAAHGRELDRVMVFPYGIGAAQIFPDLHSRGFIGTCNYADRYPPGSPLPGDADLGLRPADLGWAGFPVLWRRGLDDRSYPLDMVLGRPVLTFAHTWRLGIDFQPFAERAAAINRVAGGAAVWCGLDEVARHAYLQRHRPDGIWEVLMTANEACLHNPEPVPRRCALIRPHRPRGTVLEVDGVRVPGQTEVTVKPHGTTVVRLVASTQAAPPRHPCTIFSPSAFPPSPLAGASWGGGAQ